MAFSRVMIFAALALILGVPWLLRPAAEARRTLAPDQIVVVVTPHVPQIQREFARAFEAWHARVYGSPAHVDWRQPGGTSDIMKALDATYSAEAAGAVRRLGAAGKLGEAALQGSDLIAPKSMAIDLMLGGGSYEHGQLKDSAVLVRAGAWAGRGVEGVTILAPASRPALGAMATMREIVTDAMIGGAKFRVAIPVAAIEGGVKVLEPLAGTAASVEARVDLSRTQRVLSVRRSVAMDFSADELKAWYGENAIGAGKLYEPEQYWLGTALSGFGIVYNKDVYRELGLSEPDSFESLGDPRLYGRLALADPRQSGSVTTTLDAILSYYGWEKGWKLLRVMCGNARSFSNSSPKPPIDVSHGEAAAGLAIDFYGRGQGQAILARGQDPTQSRVGYVDPKGAAYIDADPVTMLRGGPNPVMARRFVEFCLSDEAQALWQFRARSAGVAGANPPGPGGEPMGPMDYELRRMPVKRGFYERYGALMVDKANPFEIASDRQPAGWRSVLPLVMAAFGIDTAHECRDAWGAVLAARARQDPRAGEMEELFLAMPQVTLADGSRVMLAPENVKAISAAWKNPAVRSRAEVELTEFFRSNYQRVVAMGKSSGQGRPQ